KGIPRPLTFKDGERRVTPWRRSRAPNRGHLAFHQPTLWRGPSGRGVRGDSIDVVPGPDATRTAPPPAHEAGPQNGLLRRRPPSGDPQRSGRIAVQRRGTPKGLGATARERHSHEQASGPPDHAGERPPCSREAKSIAWAPCSRRDDCHG